MSRISYGTGFWFGKHIVLPFVEGIVDAVVPGIRPKIKAEVVDTLPNWVKKRLK